MNYKAFLVTSLVGLAVASISTEAHAKCDSVLNCTINDFKSSANSKGCALIFIESQYIKCVDANASKDSSASCGTGADLPVACKQSTKETNRQNYNRWNQCYEDRSKEKEAFDQALGSIRVAQEHNWGRKINSEIKNYLRKIKKDIEEKRPGHKKQLDLVKGSLNTCEHFVSE